MSRELKFFMARVRSGSLRRMFDNVEAEHANGGVGRAAIFFDMCHCIVHYGIGYLEYRIYNFSRVRDPQVRATYMTGDHNVALTAMIDDRACYAEFENKLGFMKNFGDLTGRSYIDLNKATAKTLADFCRGRTAVFAKCPSSFGGLGVERVAIDDATDYGQLFARLFKQGKVLVEQAIVQHHEMARLSPSSVNTLRVVTVLTDRGPKVIYTIVRASDGVKPVDNGTSGGMYTVVPSDGVMKYPMFSDADSTYYDVHPLTKTRFAGFKVPYYREAVTLCLQAALRIPRLRYVGWDVAITETGPVLVEGNILPGYEMVQNYRMKDGGQGILPVFEQALGFKVPRRYDGPFIPAADPKR